MSLSDADKAELIDGFAAELEKRRNVSQETHKEHHDFIQQWIDREKRRQELYEKVKAQVVGWGVISGILSMVAGLGLLVRDWLQRGHTP
jgi:hypothetical protein